MFKKYNNYINVLACIIIFQRALDHLMKIFPDMSSIGDGFKVSYMCYQEKQYKY